MQQIDQMDLHVYLENVRRSSKIDF